MFRPFVLLPFIFTMLSNFFIVIGQESQNKMPNEQLKKQPSSKLQNENRTRPAITEQQAIELIYNEVDRAKGFTEEKDQITVWAAAADTIWDRVPEKAKEILRNAYEKVNKVKASSISGESSTANSMRTVALQQRLRLDVLAVAQRHDSAFLKELIGKDKEDDAKLKELHNSPPLLGSSSFQQRSLIELATKIAPSEPERAIELAVNSLDYGIPSEITPLFRTLLAIDPKLAHQLFVKATDRFTSDNSNNLFDAVILSTYLKMLPGPETDTATVQRFLSGALDRTSKVWFSIKDREQRDETTIGALLASTQHLYGLYRLYLPERAAEAELIIKQISESTKRDVGKLDDAASNDSTQDIVERLLDRAFKEENEDERDALYLEAALICSRRNEHARALDIASKANDGEKRKAVFNYLRSKQAESLIKQKDLHEAVKITGLIDDPELRTEVTVLFAKTFKEKKFAYETRAVLDDTRKFLEKYPNSVPHARAYLWMASAYSVFDPNVAIALLSEAVKIANKVREFNDVRPEARLLRLSAKSNQAIMVGTALGDFRRGFTQLSRTDFWQTLSIAQNFDNKVFQSLAIIATAKSALSGERKNK